METKTKRVSYFCLVPLADVDHMISKKPGLFPVFFMGVVSRGMAYGVIAKSRSYFMIR